MLADVRLRAISTLFPVCLRRTHPARATQDSLEMKKKTSVCENLVSFHCPLNFKSDEKKEFVTNTQIFLFQFILKHSILSLVMKMEFLVSVVRFPAGESVCVCSQSRLSSY